MFYANPPVRKEIKHCHLSRQVACKCWAIFHFFCSTIYIVVLQFLLTCAASFLVIGNVDMVPASRSTALSQEHRHPGWFKRAQQRVGLCADLQHVKVWLVLSVVLGTVSFH